MRESVAIFMLVLGLGIQLSAQRALPPTVQLATLSSNIAVEITARKSGVVCGPYFQFIEVPSNPRQPSQLAFLASWYDGPMKVENLKYVKVNRVELRITPGITVPTAKLAVAGFEVLHMELSISPQDFKAAPCLASVQKGIPAD